MHSTTSSGLPRLILVDDHRMVVESLRSVLASEFQIVGAAYGGDDLLSLLARLQTDCILLDLEMPGSNGFELLPRIRRAQPAARVLIVTMLVDRVLADACLSAGALGFVPKDSGLEELTLAIHEVLAGRRYVSSRIPQATHRVSMEARHLGLHRLTPRQQEIVLLLGDGLSGVDVGEKLGLSGSTVTFHKHNIMRILGLATDASLVRYAVLVRAGEEQPIP